MRRGRGGFVREEGREKVLVMRESGIGRGRVSMNLLASLVLAAAVTVILPSGRAFAGTDLPEEVTECMDCHEDGDLAKEMADGNVLSLFVRGEDFAGSVHGDISCTDCHEGISLDEHPGEKDITSREAYRAEASRICGECHEEGRGEEKSMHRYLMSRAGAPSCAGCHDVHRVTGMDGWKASVDDRTYCLACHRKRIGLTLGNGENLSLSMDEGILDGSVHSDYGCTDCHMEFDKDTHLVRDFSNRREHSLVLTEVCRECHDDMYAEFEDSIHFSMLEGGNLGAPVCIDCHGYHGVGPKETLETIAGIPCRRCHEDVFQVYRESMHGIARVGAGHLEAPVCADCHQPHSVLAANWSERLRETCVKCHDDRMKEHEEWLPNAGLHLEAVACPACHVPGADRVIDLQLFDRTSRQPLTIEQFNEFLGEDMTDGGGVKGYGSRDLWNILRATSGKDENRGISVLGRLKVKTGIDAHRLAGKGEAMAVCTTCHGQNAEAFGNVTISLVRSDGRALYYPAEGEVLTSIASVGSLGNFYAIGSTRIRLLDFLLIAAVLGGMSVPALHMTARILARKS